MSRVFAIMVVVAVSGVFAGCRQNDDPEGAKQLLGKISAGAGYRAAPWKTAPGFATRQPSFTAHSDEVEIFVNDKIVEALRGPTPLLQWPEGSIVVKEGFSDGDRTLVAVAEKRADGWYWAEYDGEGQPLFSGKPKICIDCHERRKDYSDWIYAFEFPR
jgi:hypothetical protein